MKGRLGLIAVAWLAAAVLLAAAAPAAYATVWYIAEAPDHDVGYVSKVSKSKFVVKKNSGAKVGTVIKSASGWKVMRGDRKVALIKSNGTRAYPVNMYQGSTRVGRCGPTKAGDKLSMERCAGAKVVVCLGTAPKACPARAALGAARLLLWY